MAGSRGRHSRLHGVLSFTSGFSNRLSWGTCALSTCSQLRSACSLCKQSALVDRVLEDRLEGFTLLGQRGLQGDEAVVCPCLSCVCSCLSCLQLRDGVVSLLVLVLAERFELWARKRSCIAARRGPLLLVFLVVLVADVTLSDTLVKDLVTPLRVVFIVVIVTLVLSCFLTLFHHRFFSSLKRSSRSLSGGFPTTLQSFQRAVVRSVGSLLCRANCLS
mmetsp:Transcript_23586/g.39904  ORF Transcript_23586/g.39904 Transcript_23586/m.39904 type:complete len:218 (-) Transcript_23586:906-1559(-)